MEDAAASLGTVGDIWVIVALIIPGFITFRILSWLAAYEAKFDQFTTTIYSLICSIIVFVPVAALYELDSLADIRMRILEPGLLVGLIGFGALFGFIPGIFLKLTVRRSFAFGSAWDRFARSYVGKGVIVYTTDGKQYVGWIKRMSRGKEEAKEIALGNPKLVKRKDGKIEYIELGTELLLTESAIQRILRRPPNESTDNSEGSIGGDKEARSDLDIAANNTKSLDDRRFTIRITDIQLRSGLLIALGTTLFSVGIGFAFTVLPALKEIIDQDTFNREIIRVLSNHTGMTMTNSDPTTSLQLLNSMINLAYSYAAVGAILVALGVVFTMAKLRKYTKQADQKEIKK